MKKQTAADLQKATDLQQDYLAAIQLTARHMGGKAPPQAAEILAKFATELREKTGPEFAELRVIALLTLSHIPYRREEAAAVRQEALTLCDQTAESGKALSIQDALADLLIEFAEYRRAIRPCEQAIQLSRGGGVKVATRYWRAGRNYDRAGFYQHAEEPLRKAAEFFHAHPDDSRTRVLLPVILIDLGNALRKANPAEAEKSYREAADIWERQAAPAQATTAWVNLGIVCADQDRLDESLEWYEKARRVRQADRATPRAKLGSLANNIANLHRRMKNFAEAMREAEDAVPLLEGDPVLADAYGTHGLILRDQGLDEASLEWFRKSRDEHCRQPSPNVEKLTEVMGNELAALERLGRVDEARVLEQALSAVRGDAPALVKRHGAVGAERVRSTAGVVTIALDGRHLPEAVYRECDVGTLENRIEAALEEGAGELDGHETGPENTTVFLYGADAEALFRAVEPVLRDYPLCQRARVTIRQGDRERLLVLE